MKVVIAGNWRADIHEAALAAGFEANGAEVLPFRWNQYFDLSAKGTKYFLEANISSTLTKDTS